jgi:catechol 2,3-dioxygenase
MAATTQARETEDTPLPSIPAETRIGHIHLKVADLDRAIWFHGDVMGFDLLQNFGTAAFLSAGGYHHHIGLNTWESLGG